MKITQFFITQHKTTGDKNWLAALARYKRLTVEQKAIVIDGFNRHIRACVHIGITVDSSCALELVGDARDNRRVWLESDELFWEKEYAMDVLRG